MVITNALVLSILTIVAFGLIYVKLPHWVRYWIRRHTLITDGLAMILTYNLLGRTLTALIASAITGIAVSALLYLGQVRKLD